MKLTFESKIILPASSNRKGVAACIFDTVTGEYRFLPIDKCPAEQLESLKDKRGTLLFIHNKYKIYGIIKDVANRNKPIIQFYREADLVSKAFTILNFNERELIEDISYKSIDDIRKLTETDTRFYSVQLIDESGKPSSIEKFKELIAEKAEPEKAEPEKAEPEKAEPEKAEPEKAETEKADSYGLAIEKLEAITKRLEESEKEKQDEIAKLKQTLSRINVDYDSELSEKLVDVVDISTIHEEKQTINENSAVNSTYELILKVVKENDSIAIPKEFYKSIITSIRKNLFHNMSFTVYNALVYIRFDRNSDKFIFARVDYDEALDDVRITILKPYSSTEVPDSQIIDYEIKYSQWRRYNSFTNN